MSRKTALAISIVFVVAISLPLMLMLVGQRAALDQNRKAASVESPTLDAIGDASWFSTVDQAFEDRMPLRPAAVTVDAWIDVAVLGDSPSDRVVAGSDGWLFLAESVEQPCPGSDIGPEVLAQFAEAQYIVESVGKKLVVAFAPDKAAVYPEYVGRDTRCVAATAEMFDGSPLIVSALDRMKTAARDQSLYYKLDTHWNTLGSSFLAEAIVEELQQELWSADSLKRFGVNENEGDLTRMQGLPRTEAVVDYRTERQGAVTEVERVDTTYPDGAIVEGLKTIGFSTDGVPVIEGSTLVLHDSFGWALIKTVAPYFGDVTFVKRRDPGLAYTVPLALSADTIVLEFLQRATYQQFANNPISEAFAAAFSDDAVLLTPRTPLASGDVPVSSGGEHQYVFFEAAAEAALPCELNIKGRDTIKLTRARPRIAIRLDGSVAIASSCSSDVAYWEGQFSPVR